jgi:hypothetical protein
MIVPSLLPLDGFRRVLGFNPWHFWGLTNATVPVTSACNDVVREYAWQAADAVGRHEITEAIALAEARLADALQYHTAPKYEVLTVQWPHYFNDAEVRLGPAQPPWHRLKVQLPKGKVRKIGFRRLDMIEIASPITLSDDDGDGLNETFEISFPTTVIDPEEIAIYFEACCRWDDMGGGDVDAMEPYRIRPIQVIIAAGTATVRGRAWLLVCPLQYEGAPTVGGLDPTTPGVLAANLDAYRLWYDPTGVVADESQAVMLWDTDPGACGGCCCGTSTLPASSAGDPAAEAYSVARAGISDSDNGLVVPAEALYNAASGVWCETGPGGCREPDRAKLRVLSGVPLKRCQVDDRMRLLVARMAMADMAKPICACESANRELHTWQFDVSRAGGANDEQFAVSEKDLRNPFGTRRGHIFAWREVERLAIVRGFSA